MRLLTLAQALCALAAVSLAEAKCSSIFPSSSASKGRASSSTTASSSQSSVDSAQTASTTLPSAFSSSASSSSAAVLTGVQSSTASATPSVVSGSSSGPSITASLSTTSSTTSINTPTSTIITTSIDTTAVAVTLPSDFTKTYTYEDDTIPPLTTPPTATQNAATTDVPSASPTAEPCLVNLDDPTDMFSVSTPSGLPVIPVGEQMVVLADSDFPADYNGDPYVAPTYFFQASTSIAGQYDMLVNTSGIDTYVGFDSTTGLVVTVPGSSSTVTTSLFSATCNGQIQITLDGNPYTWEVQTDGRHTTLVQGTQDATDAMTVLPTALLAAIANFNSTSTSGSGTSQRRARRTQQKRELIYEIGADPRCPAYPPNLLAVPGPNARGQESNGCGSGSTANYVPQLVFNQCCDNHDFCYDDCTGSYWEQCNADFFGCMLDACSSNYPWSSHPFKRAGCDVAAAFYAVVVSGPPGFIAFQEANDYNPSVAATNREDTGRCICVCPSPYNYYCNGDCFVDYNSDNNNCGSCGNECWNGNVCGNGQCYCPFETQTDDNNCGACGLKCPSFMKCQSGKCVCKNDQCGNSCVTLQSDPRNCGTCGTVCSSGYCYQGECVTPVVAAGQCFPGDVISNGGFDNGTTDWGWSSGDNPLTVVEVTDSYLEVLSVDHETVTIWQNITLCPGHDYALSFEIVAAGCVGGAIWQAFAAGQTLGTVSDYVPPSGGAQVGPFFMSAIPAGPTGTGTPGSADYTTYQYDATGLNVYTQVALTFQCPSTSYGLGITELDNFSMYQTD